MKVVDLIQGTHEWFVWRQQGIGGSDIAAILGIVPTCMDRPYVTPNELLAEKCGAHDRDESFAMRRGRRLEPVARVWYEKIFSVSAKPICVEHEEISWIRASLDGFANDRILEIKAPKAIDHDFALNGLVPPHYRPQLQWEMLACGAYICDYFSYNPSKGYVGNNQWACVEYFADEEYQKKLIANAEPFWELILKTRKEMQP